MKKRIPTPCARTYNEKTKQWELIPSPGEGKCIKILADGLHYEIVDSSNTETTESYKTLLKAVWNLPISTEQKDEIMSKVLDVSKDYYDRGVNNTKINYGIKL